tara:strand:+ start:206 stop:1066 length:861 start_codon:yes stop_codon:yes gene_type:complete
MAYKQETLDTINQAYQDTFGRPANFDAVGGATYWANEMDNKGLTTQGLIDALQASPEGQSAQTDPNTGKITTNLGGVDPNQSIAETWANDTFEWADHFAPGGGLSGDLTNTIWEGMAGAGTATSPTTQNVAGLLNSTWNANNPNATFQSPYYNNAPITSNTEIPGGGGATFGAGAVVPPPIIQQGWWNQFADANAFKEFLLGGKEETKAGGMDDFMKFMMFMSMMKPGGGGQGGYGGSQYGYGGLNPGGVQSAYNPMDNIASAISAFQNLPGIGGGTGLNTGTATA